MFKVHGGPFQKSGVPDLVGVIEGHFFGFEVKEPDGKLSVIQAETLADIRKAGGIANVIETPEQAINIINNALARTRRGR